MPGDRTCRGGRGARSRAAAESENDVQFLAKMRAWKGLEGGVHGPSQDTLPLPSSSRFSGVLGRELPWGGVRGGASLGHF